MAFAFGVFIVACGATHFVEIYTLWRPEYWVAAGVKVVTAIASVGVAVALPGFVPRVLNTLTEAKVSEQRRVRLEAVTEANRVKSQFLAVMSHELRTPLNAVLGYSELMASGISGPVTPSQVEHLNRIRMSSTHLVTLIDQILRFSRIEAGQERVELSRVSLREIGAEAAALVEPLARSRDLSFRFERSEDVMLVTDAGKVRQILTNLLGNAVKFTELGEVVLRLKRNDDSVVFQVSDTGIGIPPEALTQIFDPFWQVDQSSTRRIGGTGLGLSVSRDLAALLGGSVEVVSVLGGGSTFTLRLPLEAPTTAVAPEPLRTPAEGVSVG